jgi:hypothetical protein
MSSRKPNFSIVVLQRLPLHQFWPWDSRTTFYSITGACNLLLWLVSEDSNGEVLRKQAILDAAGPCASGWSRDFGSNAILINNWSHSNPRLTPTSTVTLTFSPPVFSASPSLSCVQAFLVHPIHSYKCPLRPRKRLRRQPEPRRLVLPARGTIPAIRAGWI